MKKYNKEEIQEIISNYQSGLSTVKIGKMFGTSAVNIRDILTKNGVNLRTISEAMRLSYGNSKEESVQKTKFLRSIRNSYKMFCWKAKVAVRDNFTCQNCGTIENIHIDHIKPFMAIINQYNIQTIEQANNCQELWDISNGRCLCGTCHRKSQPVARWSEKLF